MFVKSLKMYCFCYLFIVLFNYRSTFINDKSIWRIITFLI